jgi:glycosyltransferase involved in cell wall biosynthesis
MPNRQFLAIGRDTERFSSEFPPNIDWHPWFNDLSHVYQEAAILIVPSQLPETFGRVVVEAQNHGVPVIASYIGGLPESVGKGGVLVQPPDNIKRWIDSIELLFSDKIFYEKLRRNALKNAKYFNKVKMFKKFDCYCVIFYQRSRNAFRY